MRRRLFTLASAVSLLLCVATAVLWVRSYFYCDEVEWFHGYQLLGAGSNLGKLSILWDTVNFPYWRVTWYVRDPGRSFALHAFTGFGATFATTPDPVTYRVLIVPHWFVVVVSGAIAALFGYLRYRKRNAQNSMCRTCRYDLTGNTSGVCPECGTAVTGKVGA
jgi:hypothetical protein